MNLSEATKLIAVLKAAYPNHPTLDETPVAYQMALDDVPYEAGMAAAREHLKTGRFFPTPAELRGVILESLLGLPSAEEAWAEVMAQVRNVGRYGNPSWSCPAVTQAVQALGWRDICAGEELGVERAHFFRTYQVYRDRSLRGANLPALWSAEPGEPALTAGGR